MDNQTIKEEFLITLKIADRHYRMTIKRDEEEQYRKAEKQIDEKIKNYAENFAYNDNQDLLSMVVLEETINTIDYKSNTFDKENKMIEKLVEIDKVLSNHIKR
jgi:cell division protein ZapA (FtsZ GTPase activity inhibitor)